MASAESAHICVTLSECISSTSADEREEERERERRERERGREGRGRGTEELYVRTACTIP